MHVLWTFVIFFVASSAHGNGDYPEQIHLSLGKNPSSMVVTWITKEKTNTPIVKYGPKNLQYGALGNSDKWESDGVSRHTHTVTLENLEPSTLYYYQVGASQGMSKTFHFKTFPEGNNFKLRVCVFGDLGYLEGISIPHLLEAADKELFDMIIHVGDIAYDLHTDGGERGDKYMNELEPIFSRYPYMVIAGNHEDDGRNFSHFQKRFRMPNYDNQFYSFDLSAVHFIGVSTEYYFTYKDYGKHTIKNQHHWLINDLQKANENRANRPWIIGFQHRPFYCSNIKCDEDEDPIIRKGKDDLPGLEELYINNKLDLEFTGHKHSYERLYPVANLHSYNITGINPYHNAEAPIYITSGSAGCHSPKKPFDDPKPYTAFRSDDFGYTIMTIHNHSHINIQQWSVEQRKNIDDIWITKF